MTLYAQKFLAHNCGQLSLVHALAVLGIQISVSQAHRRTAVSRIQAILWGTDEHDLMRGIRKSGCVPLRHLVGPKKARRIITRYLKNGIPVIILTQEEMHWMVLSEVDGEKYSWIDSADVRIIGKSAWRTVEGWMKYEEDGRECYFFIGVQPK